MGESEIPFKNSVFGSMQFLMHLFRINLFSIIFKKMFTFGVNHP